MTLFNKKNDLNSGRFFCNILPFKTLCENKKTLLKIAGFCWPTRTRTLNDGTKNRSVTITPWANYHTTFSIASANVVHILYSTNFSKKFIKKII